MSAAPPPPDEIGIVLEVVDALEELLASARRLPFTPSVVVNEEEILELTDRIRVALPDDLVTARHLLDERHEMLGRAAADSAELGRRAQEEAERLVREAQAQASALVADHEIVRTATAQAREIVTQAEERATLERSGADDYAREVMGRLEDQLERWLRTVREGMQELPAQPAARRRNKR